MKVCSSFMLQMASFLIASSPSLKELKLVSEVVHVAHKNPTPFANTTPTNLGKSVNCNSTQLLINTLMPDKHEAHGRQRPSEINS